MALTAQGTLTSSDHAGAFSLIDALYDDVLSLVLASLGVRWLGAVAQACRRTRSHSRDAVVLRKVLHHALTAQQWRVREDQLLHLHDDHHPPNYSCLSLKRLTYFQQNLLGFTAGGC